MAVKTAVSKPYSEEPRISAHDMVESLAQEGFRPDLDDDGDIKFKWEGRVYYLRFDDNDPTFIRLCAINIAPQLEVFEQAYRYCNAVNTDIKVAKAFCVDRQGKPIVWVTAECRYQHTTEFAIHLLDLLSGVRAGVNHFREVLEAADGLPEQAAELPSSILLN